MRTCPKCKTVTLAPLSPGRMLTSDDVVHPSRCSSCHGVWMPHEAIVVGAGVSESSEIDPAQPADSREADHHMGQCPAGHGILVRARVEASPPFYLDRCATCRGIWFDAGEWAAIAATQWVRHLDDLWDPVHQKQMREHTERAHRLETLQKVLGPALSEHLFALADGLKGHAGSSIAVAFLLDEIRPHGHRPA